MATLKTVREHFEHASIKSGVITVRDGFFYSGGKTAENLVNRIKAAFPDATILDSGEVWKDFRGGAPVVKQTHWWVRFTLPAETPVEAYGQRGFKNLPWTKIFSSLDAMNAWVEKHDATVLGTRSAE